MATQRDKSLANEERFSREFACGVLDYFKSHTDALQASKRYKRIQRSVQAYFSEGHGDETEIQSGGSNGELTLLKPNEYRSLTQSQLNIITQDAPAYEAGAENSDVESADGARLAQGILNHELRFKRLDSVRVRRAEIAAVCSESFLHAPWDEALGAKTMANEAGTGAVANGDFLYEVIGPWDAAFDWLSNDKTKPRQWAIRVPRNRWVWAARFPKHREAILKAPAFREGLGDFSAEGRDHRTADDYIAVYYYYCEADEDCPTGRQSQLLDEDNVLEDSDLSYARCPVFRLAPCERILGPGGHTNNFEVLPITEAYAAEVSIIISNHSTFGGQVIAYPKGSGVKPHQLGNGMAGLEYDSMAGTLPPPTALTLLATPKEVFEMTSLLRSTGERFLAVSAASRGESVEGDSGSKSALLAAAAERYATSFHQTLARSDEDVGMHIVDTTARKAKLERVIMVAGKAGTYSARVFKGDQIKGIAGIYVRARTPMLDTPDGRQMAAQVLLKLPGGLTTGEQYLEFITTGRHTPQYDGPLADVGLIERENDELRDLTAPMPLVAPSDQHVEHWKRHAQLFSDPEVRRNGDLMQRVNAHLKMHELRLTQGHPEFAGEYALLITGQKPLPPLSALQMGAGGPPSAGGPPGPGAPPSAATPPMPANDNAGPPPALETKQPDMPSMPTDPTTGEPPMPPPAQAGGM